MLCVTIFVMVIAVGSQSDRKLRVVEKVFHEYFDSDLTVKGYSVSSNVPDTPIDKQTRDGAHNRAIGLKKADSADYYVGLESGLVDRYGDVYEEAWACIIHDDKPYFGYSSGLKVPDSIMHRMKTSGLEHSDVMTLIEYELGKMPNDTWGTYSGGIIIREISLEEAVRNALIQSLPHEGSLFRE